MFSTASGLLRFAIDLRGCVRMQQSRHAIAMTNRPTGAAFLTNTRRKALDSEGCRNHGPGALCGTNFKHYAAMQQI